MRDGLSRIYCRCRAKSTRAFHQQFQQALKNRRERVSNILNTQELDQNSSLPTLKNIQWNDDCMLHGGGRYICHMVCTLNIIQGGALFGDLCVVYALLK
jgi:hypothetical protein